MTFLSFSVQASEEILVEGVFAVTEQVPITQAYEQAEKLAKASAAKQIGQYYEVVSFTDTGTGKRKEYTASVSAGNLQYEVVSRRLELLGEEQIAVVKIQASYDLVDLHKSLERFIENQDMKSRLDTASSHLSQLSGKISTQELLIEKLEEAQAALFLINNESQSVIQTKQRQIEKLQTELLNVQASLVKDSDVFFSTVDAFLEKSHLVSKGVYKTAYKKALIELQQQERRQLDSIQAFAAQIDNRTRVSSYLDIEAGQVIYMPIFEFEVETGILPTLFGKKYKDGFHVSNRNRAISRMYSGHINPTSKGLALKKYSLFYIVEINDFKYEFPIVLPLSSNMDSGKSHNDFCESGSIKGKGRNQRLCIQYRSNMFSLVKNETLASREYKEALLSPLRFSIEEQVKIKQYYEIKEVG